MNNPTHYKVVEADLVKDRSDIIALWGRNLSGPYEARYEWMYRDNSHIPSMTWLLKTASCVTVGATGLSYRRMKIGDQMRLVGHAVDLCVDRKYRSLGPAIKLQKAITGSFQDKGMSLIYGFPNILSEKVLLRVGYRTLGPLERWTKILRCEYIINRYRKGNALLKILSFPIDKALTLLSRELHRRNSSDIRIDVLDNFDERFDHLWETASSQYGTIGERTASYLNWRFKQCPHKSYEVFCLFDREDVLQGYIIYHIKKTEKKVIIADILAREPAFLHKLLRRFVHRMRFAGFTSITMFCCGTPTLKEKLKSSGFHKRQGQGLVLVYFGDKDPRIQYYLDENPFYITVADADF